MYERNISRLGNCRKGASAIEFAMVTPFLLFIVAAIIGYGTLFVTVISLHQLGADAARASVGGLSLIEKRTLATQIVQSSSHEYPLLEREQIGVTMTFDDQTQVTVLQLDYKPESHPIHIFDGLLPMPADAFTVRQTITEHRQ